MTELPAIEVVHQQDRCTILLVGDIDVATAEHVIATGVCAIQTPGVTTVIIDAGGVEFIDSTGIGALVSFRNAVVERGASLALINAPARVRDVLAIVGLDAVFDLGSDGEAARQAVNGT